MRKNIYTVEFSTFVVEAESKQKAVEMIKNYVTNQSKDLDGFFKMRAVVTEKDVLGRDGLRALRIGEKISHCLVDDKQSHAGFATPEEADRANRRCESCGGNKLTIYQYHPTLGGYIYFCDEKCFDNFWANNQEQAAGAPCWVGTDQEVWP